jgi:hypothetical protein
MDVFYALRWLWRFFRGRCPQHNVKYADSRAGACEACMKEFGPHLQRGSMWD